MVNVTKPKDGGYISCHLHRRRLTELLNVAPTYISEAASFAITGPFTTGVRSIRTRRDRDALLLASVSLNTTEPALQTGEQTV